MHQFFHDMTVLFTGILGSATAFKVLGSLGSGGFFNEPIKWVRDWWVNRNAKKEATIKALEVHKAEDKEKFDSIKNAMEVNDRKTLKAIQFVGETLSSKIDVSLKVLSEDFKGDFSDLHDKINGVSDVAHETKGAVDTLLKLRA
jgi:hypothetical protein